MDTGYLQPADDSTTSTLDPQVQAYQRRLGFVDRIRNPVADSRQEDLRNRERIQEKVRIFEIKNRYRGVLGDKSSTGSDRSELNTNESFSKDMYKRKEDYLDLLIDTDKRELYNKNAYLRINEHGGHYLTPNQIAQIERDIRELETRIKNLTESKDLILEMKTGGTREDFESME